MNTSPLRVLVAENQYLIAMEVERILQERLACAVKIVPVSGLADALSAGDFQVVIIAAALAEALNVERAKLIVSAGAVPVFLSSYDHFLDAGTILLSYPVVSKPPQPDELAAAVLQAKHDDGPLDGEGFLNDR
jgi:hypothetical protein